LQVLINLIKNTTTLEGLEVQANLDESRYETGIKVTDQEFNSIVISLHSFRGEWNYIIKPRVEA